MKDHLRDYATEAFRFYARSGCPDYEDLKQQLYDAALEASKREIMHSGNISKPTEYAVINAERAVDERKGELLDILAVEQVMALTEGSPEGILCRSGNPMNYYIRRAIEIVYFADADKPLQKGDISMRVHKAELEIPASERQIYYWLSKARRMFAEERGLRIYNKFPEKLAVQGVNEGV
jgi:hypothetical protein